MRVEVRDGRHQVRGVGGVLRAQRLHGPADRARVALIGQTALLLGGDDIGLDIEVGPGAHLDLSEVAATVAYHGRGRSASYRVRIRVGEGSTLRYAAEPFVLADGAEVTRILDIDVAERAAAVLRETVVFGRSGEDGGWLDNRTMLRRAGVDVAREWLVGDASARRLPGVVSGAKVLDTVLVLGAAVQPPVPGQRFALPDPDCTVIRALGPSPEPRLGDLVSRLLRA